MRGRKSAHHILPRTLAGIDRTQTAQLFEYFAVERNSLALRVRREGSPDVRTFLPLKAKPKKIFEDAFHEFWFAATEVQILHPQHQGPTLLLRTLLCPPKS